MACRWAAQWQVYRGGSVYGSQWLEGGLRLSVLICLQNKYPQLTRYVKTLIT